MNTHMNEKDVAAHFSNQSEIFDSFYNEKKGFVATIIDKLFRKSMRLRFEKVMASVAPYPGKSILDVGCGAGRYSIALALNGVRRVLGVDFAQNMISLAQRYTQQLDLQEKCTFKQLDFMHSQLDETFDHAIAMGVLDYVSEPVPFVQKMMSHTTGSVMISFPSSGGLIQYFRKHYFYKIKKCPVYFYNRKDVETIAQKAGAIDFSIDRLAKDFFLTIHL